KDEKQQLGIRQSFAEASEYTLVFCSFCCTCFGFDTPDGKGTFRGRQDATVVRELRHEEGADGANANSSSTFDDEEPLPCTNVMCSIELKDGCGEEPTKGVSELLRNIQGGNAFAKFRLRVP